MLSGDAAVTVDAGSPASFLQRERRRHRLGLLLLLLALILMILIAISTGSVAMELSSLLETLRGRGVDETERAIVFDLRLPRIAAAGFVGAGLALAGVQMQVLIRNPLADPYILGISGGAAVAALLAIIFDLGAQAIGVCAALGALVSMSLVLFLGRGAGPWSSTRLLLTGVVVSAGWGAVISLLLAVGPTEKLRGMLFWLMGDFSSARAGWPLILIVVAGLLVSLLLARRMNVLAVGRQQAAVLGLEVDRLRLVLYLIASLLTATAVVVAGSVGFVGLVVPHLMRLVGGADHRWVIPSSFIAGACLLIFADTLARSVIAPQQLPVGVLTAFVGVPVFLFLLWRGTR